MFKRNREIQSSKKQRRWIKGEKRNTGKETEEKDRKKKFQLKKSDNDRKTKN
jgi:hypothetical protein